MDSGLLVGDAASVSRAPPAGALGDLPGRDRARTGGALTGRWPRRWPASGTPDREAWHRAFAAEGPDPELVDALELVGSRALRRGGYVAALAAYERAAALSTDPAQRAASRLRGGPQRLGVRAGGAARRSCCRRHVKAPTDPLLLCDIARLRGHIEVNLGSATEAHRIFVDAAHAVHPVDPVRALEIGVAAAVMRTFGADSGTPLPSDDLLAAAAAGRLAADAVPAAHAGRHDPGGRRQTGPRPRMRWTWPWTSATQVDDRDVLWNLGNAALQLGDDDGAAALLLATPCRGRGRPAPSPRSIYCLQRLCFGHFLAGDHVAVRSSAEEAVALGDEHRPTRHDRAPDRLAGSARGPPGPGRLRRPRCTRLDELVAAHPLGIMTDPVHDLTRWAKGTARRGHGGQPPAPCTTSSRFRLPVLARMAATERIEAAVRAGETATARAWAEDLAAFAEATRRPWALATVAFGRALTADPSDAEALFQEALSHARSGPVARSTRRAPSWRTASGCAAASGASTPASTCVSALETFQDLRAEALAARANQELRASGETARKRDPSTLVKLTPTELKIAQLVSSGMSNKDVAAQCWISPRTVAFHLRNVFAKAGVTSRGELAQLDLA